MELIVLCLLLLKISIPTSWNFVPTKNCPEYGVKAQEIPLFVCNTSDALIGWFEFNGNGKFQIFPQTEINITQMLNNIISNITSYCGTEYTNWIELLINQAECNYTHIIFHRTPAIHFLL